MKDLILIDGNSFVFRAYYATVYKKKNIMTNSEGQEVNALFIFMKMFQKILKQNHKNICVFFDSPDKTIRHELYSNYKQGRPSTPISLINQISLIKEYLELLGIRYYFQSGYEADDMIGTIAKQASYQKIPVFIFSSDKDFLQLIDDQITVCLIKKGLSNIVYYDVSKLKEEYHLTPEQMVDFKSLVGDSSDNILGVPKIGIKTAIELLNKFHTLENIFNCLSQLKGKIKENLISFRERVFFNRFLMTINILASLSFDYMQTQRKDVQKEALFLFLKNHKISQEKEFNKNLL
ncbi:5'-3' exonuclease [Candidatus Phytoplasma pini]|uniref:5'-3' exonuclease n=1 Tax=Candidatus Phytoplasma pini TaxID=267362 RepID=A0A559KJB3_9MOLU|nr:5'-3' exonuclease H3TH domain-containing protein [Candidatus Phytoplasma pini]TVY12222.1 DNA polymerase I [Candidatus Phytoplasma pini]